MKTTNRNYRQAFAAFLHKKKRPLKLPAIVFGGVIAPVCVWFALALFSVEIPAGNYSHFLPVEGVLLNSRNDLRLAPQLDASVIVHDRITFYNLQPALNSIIQNMDLPGQVRERRLDSLAFVPPDTVRARGGVLLSAWRLSAEVNARVDARLSLLNEYTLGMPLDIDIDILHPAFSVLESAVQKAIDAENLSLEFDLREETGMRSLRIQELRLHPSNGATHTLTLAFRAGFADFLRWVFRLAFSPPRMHNA